MPLEEKVRVDVIELIYDMFHAMQKGYETEQERAQAMIIGRLLNAGYNDISLKKILDGVKSAGNIKDIEQLIADYLTPMSESMNLEAPEIYKASILIPMVQKDNVKSAIKELLRDVETNRMKILKKSVKPGPVFKVNEEDILNVVVIMKIRTQMDRYRIKRSLQPKYTIQKLSYSRKDAEA